jgi:hypothetical protein
LIVRAVASEKTGVFQTDMVMHAAGRVPEITDLNLDAAGIDWEKWGGASQRILAKCVDSSCVCGGRCRSQWRFTAGSCGELFKG